jgi:ABC-type multidrug transport system fused ATPase/permease subunit
MSIITLISSTELFKILIYKKIFDIMILLNFNYSTVNLFIQLFIINFIQNIVCYFENKLVLKLIDKIFKKVSINLCQDNYKLKFYKNINNLWTNLNNLEILSKKVLIDLPKIIVFVIYLIYLLYNIYPVFVYIFIPVNLLLIYLLYSLHNNILKYEQKKLNLDSNIKNKLLETISNIEFVKLNNYENYEINKISNLFDLLSKNKEIDKFFNLLFNLMHSLYANFMLFVIYYIGIDNLINKADLLFVILNIIYFYSKINRLGYMFNNNVLVNIDSHNNLDNKIVKYEDNIEYNKNIIECKNLTFSYNGINNVLSDLNFGFEENKINLLFGLIGSGKTTIVKLILRLYEMNNLSNIYFKGENIKSLNLDYLRNKIIFVSNEPCIFDDTILYNIKYGNELLKEDFIEEMCDLIYSRDWFNKNKNKITGFRGKNLAGSEKKKIQIINAICKDFEVIIFDEPTNTLDSNAIIWFIEFIKLLKDKYGKTVIILTHDLRLKKIGDCIVDL